MLYKKVLQISDLSQICAVLFDNLLPTRIQLHNAPLVETLAPIGKKTRTTNFQQASMRPNLYPQARWPETGTGGSHLVPGPDYRVDA